MWLPFLLPHREHVTRDREREVIHGPQTENYTLLGCSLEYLICLGLWEIRMSNWQWLLSKCQQPKCCYFQSTFQARPSRVLFHIPYNCLLPSTSSSSSSSTSFSLVSRTQKKMWKDGDGNPLLARINIYDSSNFGRRWANTLTYQVITGFFGKFPWYRHHLS